MISSDFWKLSLNAKIYEQNLFFTILLSKFIYRGINTLPEKKSYDWPYQEYEDLKIKI